MADYLKVWKTRKVTVGLRKIGSVAVLERIRGSKKTKKQVMLCQDKSSSLVQAVVHAITVQPKSQVQARLPIAMVDGGCGTLTVSWEPYNFGTCNAIMIRGGRGNCVAVEQQNAWDFALWLIQQIPVLEGVNPSNRAK